MTISASDITFKKSVTVTDTSANGGRKGHVAVVSGARHSLFPRVTKAERTAGVTRYRKEFMCNGNADDDIAYDAMVFLEFPSNGGDRFAVGKGTQTDTQGDLATAVPIWTGVGSLQTALSGGETSVALTMESDDFIFPNGGYLHLTNKFMTSQTIESGVAVGDSVVLSGGTWRRVAATSDITYPTGLCVGSDAVMTIQATTHEEWLALADNLYEDEDIGTGDGADTSPELTTLAHVANGIYAQAGGLPVVTATCGGVTKTVNVAADGSCSGNCLAGQLNMATGVWTTDITWTSAPDNATDITVTYRENCFSYAGNIATVELSGQVANAYSTANSYGAGCIHEAELKPASANWSENSAAGTYDESAYPLTLFNDGTEYDLWTLTFTGATAFTVSGANEGSVGTGSISVDFSPTNPNTGQPYFTIARNGWGGVWSSGETITFTTAPAGLPIWWREIVPPATAAESNNIAVLGWYLE